MNENKASVEEIYKTNVIVWAAILLSQFLFLGMLFVIKRDIYDFDFSKPLLGENAPVILALAFMALSSVILSFVLKRKFIAQAIAEQKTELLQNGIITAIALCEAASLFGLTLAFAFDYQYFFIFFALGILGTLAHFPKRDDFFAASYKK